MSSEEKAPSQQIAMIGIKTFVLVILCLQNSFFTVLRRYSQGVLKETYSKYEVLMLAEFMKIIFSVYMISKENSNIVARLQYLMKKAWKMFFLAVIYGTMNILSFVALRNIGAGQFTIFAQCKIITTASFSSLLLGRRYSAPQWRALIGLSVGVMLFSEPIWNKTSSGHDVTEGARPWLGTAAVLTEVTLSGFASIYFEKVIKTDPEKLSIWENNYLLALGSFPIYIGFILFDASHNGTVFGTGWSGVAFLLSVLGAAGGLLVALSIKYGDSILKTLATTGAIILSSILDHHILGGPLTPIMMLSGIQVIVNICNYTFDTTPKEVESPKLVDNTSDEEMNDLLESLKRENSDSSTAA